MSTAPSRATPTRDRILAAAVEMLGETGLSDITTRALAQRAGVNAALIHYHFGSRAMLLVDAALTRLDDQLTEPLVLLAGAPSTTAGAAHVLRWIGQFDPNDPDIRLVADLTIEAFRNPEVRPKIAQVLELSRHELAQVLTPPDRGLADLLAALFDGLLLHRMVDPAFDLEPAATALEQRLCRPSTPDEESHR